MANFSIVLVPYKIEKALQAQPPITAIEPVAPLPPKIEAIPPSPTKNINKWGVFLSISFSIPLSYWMVGVFNIKIITALSFLWFVILAYYTYQDFSYPNRKKQRDNQARIIELQNRERCIDYDHKIKVHEIKKIAYQQELGEFLTPENIANFRFTLIRESLQQTISFDRNDSDARVGYCEDRFYQYLYQYFKQKIKRQLAIEIPNYGYPIHYLSSYQDEK
jgi:hypothetical protein